MSTLRAVNSGAIMPTILREGPYRFYFFSGDVGEPRHVHVDAAGSTAKFWLTPVALRIALQHQKNFVEAWDAYFGT